MIEAMEHVLVITAVDAERESILSGLKKASERHAGEMMQARTSSMLFDVITSGVGSVASATATMKAVQCKDISCIDRYCLIINAGIAGAFRTPGTGGDGWTAGALVLADQVIAADLGAESDEGFLTLERLGYGIQRFTADETWNERILRALHRERSGTLKIETGPILTVQTVTGTAETATFRSHVYPGVRAEAMEGYGVAYAANALGIPFIEIRSISNPVGPRLRDQWNIPEALRSLERLFAHLGGGF